MINFDKSRGIKEGIHGVIKNKGYKDIEHIKVYEINYFPEFKEDYEFIICFQVWYTNVMDVLSGSDWNELRDEGCDMIILYCSIDKQKYLHKILYQKIRSVLTKDLCNKMDKKTDFINDGLMYLQCLMDYYQSEKMKL